MSKKISSDPLEEQAFSTHFGHLRENFISCFKCEYQKEGEQGGINIPGRLYISDHHICFASGQLPLFLRVIPMIEVSSVLKKNATFLFPKIIIEHANGIECFNSVTLRDKAYDLITTLVNKARGELSLGIDLKTMQNEGRRLSKKGDSASSFSDEDVNYSDLVFHKDDFERNKNKKSEGTQSQVDQKSSSFGSSPDQNQPPFSAQNSPNINNNNNNNNQSSHSNEDEKIAINNPENTISNDDLENEKNEYQKLKVGRRQKSKSFIIPKQSDIVAIQPLLTSSQLQFEPTDSKLVPGPVITPNLHHNNNNVLNVKDASTKSTSTSPPSTTPPSLSPSTSPPSYNALANTTPLLQNKRLVPPNTDPTNIRSTQHVNTPSSDFEDEETSSNPHKLDLDVLRQGKKKKPVKFAHSESSEHIPQLLSELIDLSDIPPDSPPIHPTRHLSDLTPELIKKNLSKSMSYIDKSDKGKGKALLPSSLGDNIVEEVKDKGEKEKEKDDIAYPPIGNPKLFSHIPIISPPVVEEFFPITCKQFFSFFINNRTFWKHAMEKNENYDVVIPEWTQHPTHFSRVISFSAPIKGAPMGPKTTRNEQTHQISFVDEKHLVYDMSNKALDVPFGDGFLVQTLFDIKEDRPGGCTLRISWRVHFLKSLWVKNMIERGARPAQEAFFQVFRTEAHKHLKTIQLNNNVPDKNQPVDSEEEEEEVDEEIDQVVEDIQTPDVEPAQSDFFYSFSLSGKTFVTSFIILFVVFFGLFYLTICIRSLEDELYQLQNVYQEYEERTFFLQTFTSRMANRIFNSSNALDHEWTHWQRTKGLNWRLGIWKDQIITLQNNLQHTLDHLNGLADDVNLRSSNIISESLIRSKLINSLDSEKIYFTQNMAYSSFPYYLFTLFVLIVGALYFAKSKLSK